MDKRDNHGWSLKTIHHRWKYINETEAGRKQISRMRKFIRNGGITHKETYEQPRNIVWEEVQNLDRNMITFHDRESKKLPY